MKSNNAYYLPCNSIPDLNVQNNTQTMYKNKTNKFIEIKSNRSKCKNHLIYLSVLSKKIFFFIFVTKRVQLFVMVTTTHLNMSAVNATVPDEVDIEQRQTLWVGGLNEKVTEEILYELFQNVS